MKITFNLTTSYEDLNRFPDRTALLSLMEGFDGVELMWYGEDKRNLIPKERVIGLHMNCPYTWLDIWNGDEAALIREYGSLEECVRRWGGMGKEVILKPFRENLKIAKRYGAEYVVYHVSDCFIEESFTWKYHHTDEEVIDATCEMLDELFAGEDGSIALLLENLWQPGLSLTRPEMTKRLLTGIHYPNKGIMLDTGHLLHTNTKLRTQEEGLAYIHSLLDAHGELCSHIRGIHLNQSLTGEYCEQIMADPPAMEADYDRRNWQAFVHAFKVDQHLPFTADGVDELVQRIDPEYLTFEFITDNGEQHRRYLDMQKAALRSIFTK